MLHHITCDVMILLHTMQQNKKWRGVKIMAVKNNKKRIMITLTEQQVAQLETQSQKTGFSKSALVALALQEKMKDERASESMKA